MNFVRHVDTRERQFPIAFLALYVLNGVPNVPRVPCNLDIPALHVLNGIPNVPYNLTHLTPKRSIMPIATTCI